LEFTPSTNIQTGATIAKSTGVEKSTVRDVVKHGDTRNGDTHDAPRPERPTKTSTIKKKKIVEGIVGNEPFLTLHDIADKANVGLGKTTVDKIIGEVGFKLIIPRKKQYLRKGQKQKR
jgi:transposase